MAISGLILEGNGVVVTLGVALGVGLLVAVALGVVLGVGLGVAIGVGLGVVCVAVGSEELLQLASIKTNKIANRLIRYFFMKTFSLPYIIA